MASRKRRKIRNGHARNSADVHGTLGVLRDDLDTLQKDMQTLMTDARTVATREMGSAVERIGDWSTDNLSEVRKAVRNQPLKACALSIGAGALIGALFLR